MPNSKAPPGKQESPDMGVMVQKTPTSGGQRGLEYIIRFSCAQAISDPEP
jgi:hypothetical protein